MFIVFPICLPFPVSSNNSQCTSLAWLGDGTYVGQKTEVAYKILKCLAEGERGLQEEGECSGLQTNF